jgi:molecular chaperone GrpE
MTKRKKIDGESAAQDDHELVEGMAEEVEQFRVEDRRHWAEGAANDVDEEEQDTSQVRQPSLIDEFRQRAEAAEKQLQDYIEAFKRFKQEHEEFRVRLTRDVDRKVELMFGELVGELLETMDDLDLAEEHARRVPEAEPLAQGVNLVRSRFLATLERHGVSKVILDGAEFDPNEAEAVRIDPVDSAEQNGRVTETLRAGYRLGDRVIRAARVAVGRHDGS